MLAGEGDRDIRSWGGVLWGRTADAAEATPLCRSISDSQGVHAAMDAPNLIHRRKRPKRRGRPCCTWLGCGLLFACIAVGLRDLVGRWAGTRSTAVLKMHEDTSSGWRSGEGGARARSRRLASCVTWASHLDTLGSVPFLRCINHTPSAPQHLMMDTEALCHSRLGQLQCEDSLLPQRSSDQ